MTGWRLGWMVLPEALLRPAECLGQNFFISPPSLSQIAGEAAFDCGAQLDGHVAAYARNRALLLRELPKAGIDRLAPRSDEHTSELQSLMRISYAVFCLNTKKNTYSHTY